MKTIQEKIAGLLRAGGVSVVRRFKPCLVLLLWLAAVPAFAQVNDNFANAIIIAGLSGTTNGINNSTATLEPPCETNLVYVQDYSAFHPVGASVWYAWTAPASGTVQFDTTNSDFDTVLSIWTTTNGLCDSSLTNIVADDDSGEFVYNDVNPTSYLTFPTVMGTTYFICVEGYDNGYPGPSDPATGDVVLNWSMVNVVTPTVPTIAAGTFEFTAAAYTVSELDSTAPSANDGGTVSGWTDPNNGNLGARLTVTRTGGSSGRVLVDYTTLGMTYTNYLQTNTFGTIIISTLINSNGVGYTTNYTVTTTIFTNLFGYYLNGYQQYPVTGARTNLAIQIFNNITTNFTVVTNPLVRGALVPVPTNVPPVTNYFTTNQSVLFAAGVLPPVGISTNLVITNYFSYAVTNQVFGQIPANGATLTNPPNIYTNFFTYWTNTFETNFYGMNIAYAYYASGGAQFFTNYYYTNIVLSNFYSTNVVYTNGLLFTNLVFTNQTIGALTNYTWSSSNNVGQTLSQNGGSGTIAIPTNMPALGTANQTYSTNTDSSGDLIISVTNVFRYPTVISNQIVSASSGFTTTSNTLVFDDFQMSQDIVVPVSPLASGFPGNIGVTLLNPRLDPLESSDLITPTVLNPPAGYARVTALSSAFSPDGAAIFNIERSTFKVDKDVAGGNAVVTVYRTGNLGDTVSVQYTIDPTCNLNGGANPPSTFSGGFCPANQFTLQAGSDYATPNSDYTPVTGTLSWGKNDTTVRTISIPILNNGLVENNEDMLIQLYNPTPTPSSTDPGAELGEVNWANLTEVFDDLDCGQQPAGAVDRCWNTEGSSASVPPFLTYPGTQAGVSGGANGNGGIVYAVAEQPDGKTIIGGSFISYDSNPYNRIVRLLNDGYQDSTFLASPNSGANDFISSVIVQPDGKILVAGKFTAFNGYNRYHIARLLTDGSVDTSFNPGLGVNGTNAMVWAMALQGNGQIVIAGQFTSYNGTNMASVARLNANGSLDPSFNPGTGPDGVVNAVAVDSSGRVVIGGDFDSVNSSTAGGVARLNVNGTVDSTFALGIGTYNPDTDDYDPVYALAIQPDGKILVGGGFSYVDLSSYSGLVRLLTDGTVDTSFVTGTGTYDPVTDESDSVFSITLQPDGKILIGGNFARYNQTRRWGIARLFSYGSLDTSFMDPTYNQFAGLINHYFNASAVNTNLYPAANTRNFVYSIGVEPGTTNVIIGGGFLQVGGGYSRQDVRPRSNVARLVGGATPGPGNLQFSYNNYTVDKSAPTLFISLYRTNGNLGPISATFSTNMASPGPGIASATDFSTTTFNPLWPTIYNANGPNASWMISPGIYGPNYSTLPAPPVNQPYVSLTINNNAILTGNVNANMALSAPDGSTYTLGGEVIGIGPALGPLATAPLTIIDDNYQPGVLGFSSPTYTVIENGGNAVITITRTNGTQGVVQVNYVTGNGTATNGIDFTNVTGTLTFNVGDTSKTFTVPVRNNNILQPDKTVNLTLFNVTGGATLGLTNAVLTIINDNFGAGHISFSATNFNVNEDGGTGYVTLSRLGGSTGTIKVTVLTFDGSALNGVDYTGYTNTITWNNKAAFTTNIAIPVFHDSLVTSNRFLNVILTNLTLNTFVTNACWGLITNTTLTINNVDFSGAVQFSSPVYSVKKYAGSALVPVVRTGGSAQPIYVYYNTVDGTATNGVDYVATNGMLTFANGQVIQYITVPILNTNLNSGLLAFGLVLTNASPSYGLGAISNATMNIIDSSQVNETPGSPDTTYSSFAGFNGPVYALSQQANNQLIAGGDFTQADGVPRQRIARLNADGSLDASFSYPSSSLGANGAVRAVAVQTDGRILVGGDFTNFNSVAYNRIARLNQDGSLDSLFNPGSGADSTVYALAETFVGGVPKVLVGGAFANLNGVAFNYIGRLNDDTNGDCGTPDTTFNAGGLGANGTVYAVAVQSDGKVVIGGDFTTYNTTPVNHVARLNTDGSLDLNFTNAISNASAGANGSVRAITIQLDGKILIGGAFTNVNGSTMNHIARLNTDGSLDSTFTGGVVGADDLVYSIAVQADERIVVGGQFIHCNGVSRSHITRLNPDGTVDPTINFGAGANDFVDAIAIQEGTVLGYPTNVPDEKIIIGGGFTQYFGQPYDHIVRIYGGSISGVGAFEFSAPTYQIDENGLSALITVVRTGGTSGTNANLSGDIYVPFATTNGGTAVAGINYSNVVTNLDFPEGEVIQTVVIPVMDDNVITSNLTVNLAINPVAPASYGDQPTAVLTIINDDSAISFSSSNYQVAKNVAGGVEYVDITRIGSTSGTSTVIFNTTTNGTALPVTDYTPLTNATVTFNPGVTDVTVPIPINNNGLPEGPQTVGMSLSNAIGSALYSPSNATLTINDTVHLPGVLFFSATNYNVGSSDGNAYLTVYRTNGFTGSVTVNYATVAGTAQPVVDYIATNGQLTIASGYTNGTIVVPLIAQSQVKPPVFLSVILSNAINGATLASPSNATVTISSAIAGISFVSATNTVSESNGVVVLTVQRLYNTNNAVSVNFNTADGTALAGLNYVTNGGTLNFTAGQLLSAITIQLLDDTNVTGTLQFNVKLSSPTGGAQLLAPSNSVVLETDADAGLSFTTNTITVLKNAGTATIAVVCSNPGIEPVVVNSNSIPMSVDYYTLDGTAVAGTDYQSASGTLVFTNGIVTNTFQVVIYYNTQVAANKTFTVVLTNAVAPGHIVPPSTQAVVIAESNAGLRFSQSGYSAFKNGVNAVITVNRIGYTNNTVSVNFATANGTAVSGQNYYATNGTLIFSNGVASQTFNVPLIANNIVAPNLTVLLQLSSPTNGFLTPPSAAVLTILENGGSYVIPAGAQMVTNYTSLANGTNNIIGSNDTVQVLFALRDSAGLNVTNLNAILLATNGVLSPVGVPASATNYGPLTVYGHSVSRPFKFTANGTNSFNIAPTFALYDNAKYIGTAVFGLTIGTWTTSFYNSNAIIILDTNAASPYPAVINVSGVGGTLIKATVTLNKLTHTYPHDIDALVVSPAGTNTLIMAHIGASLNGTNVSVTNISMTFDDAATNYWPQTGVLYTGTNKPTQFYPVQAFP